MLEDIRRGALLGRRLLQANAGRLVSPLKLNLALTGAILQRLNVAEGLIDMA